VKDRKQFEVEPPTSLKEIVRDELIAGGYDDFRRGKPVEPVTDEGIDALMQKIYQHVEKQALATYHSNEPWALRQWALSNILKDEIINEATAEMAHGLISPVIEWQGQQEFDPLAYFKDQLTRKSRSTVQGYLLTAARFVGLIGRKRHYTDEDVIRYLKFMDKRYDNDNTYNQECVRLLQFLRRLPGADRGRQLPVDKPKVPRRKKYVHAMTIEDIKELVLACVLDNISYRMVVRLACSTIFGRRVGELTNFQIHLNGANSTILFATRKGGEQVAHPLPQSLVPLFEVPMDTISEGMLQRWLRQICKKAGISLPYRGGFHSIRRTVATIIKHQLRSDIDTHKFMRWAEPRELGILAQYDQTRYEDVDRLVLENHPIVKVWEEALPYILKVNRSYKPFYDNAY
jgi:integrase